MRHDREEYLRVVATYLLVRKSRWLLPAMALIGVVVGVWGSIEAPTPTATDTGGASVEFWRLLAVGSASLPVLTLSSPLEALEATGGSSFHRLRSLVLCGVFAISSGCILTAAAVGVDAAVTPLIARALLAWFGLALISGRVLGWTYSWILPWATLCVLLYWGHSSSSGDFHWWEFTAQPIGHLPSTLLAVGLFTAGVAAYNLSPWRIHRFRRARTSQAGAH
ncbi:hypothetical protein O7614_20370 [Micromonospora sp. WMMD961]|uniref:hypothetical protein n=1 Tax=Micromonospora sp. WMMD961 TaxID=3016100 RepID=UPI002415E25C|nr:hypothetical protein [Micromonospora sp. WMMD961]MDG4782018.1 hypothetical protein [Micromonospora sp. WMMD961]